MPPDLVPPAAGAKHRRTYKPMFDPAKPPPRVTRAEGSALLYARLGVRVSPRSLEKASLPTKLVNGRATFNTEELLAHGRAMLDAAPPIRGGKRAAAGQSSGPPLVWSVTPGGSG